MWSNSQTSKGRYAPNDFKYNGRVALALVPSLLVAAALGGKMVIACLTLGAMITYVLDSLQLRDGALLAGWGTLATSEFMLISNLVNDANDDSVVLLCGIVTSMGTVFALAGVWTTLQFKWFHLQYPGVALGFERLLITSSIPVSAIALTIFLATVVHVSTVPFYLLMVLAGLHYTLARPLPCSFHSPREGPSTGGRAAPPVYVQTRSDLLLSVLLLVVLPPTFYVAVHWYIMSHMVHVWSTLLLMSLPLLFLAFLDSGNFHLFRSQRLQQVVMVFALFVALIGFEGRVLFHAFAQYIKLQPPFNYVAVTVATMGAGALASAHFTGALGTSLDVTLAGTLLLLCTTAGGIAAGIPFHWLPAPLVAACGLAMYYDSRSLREYIAFVLGCLGTSFWFVYSHFWFLDINVEGMSLRTMCKLMLAAIVPALLIPGVVAAGVHKAVVDVLLLFQAISIAVLERHLYGGYDPTHEVMYPGYLLVFTSMLGLLAAYRLLKSNKITATAAWLSECMYMAKASMLLLPRAALVPPCFLLLLAVSAPLLLYRVEPGKRRLRLHPMHALLHVVGVIAAVIHARFAIFDVVQYLFAARPSESLLLGALVVTVAVGCAPLVAKGYAGVVSAQRVLACTAAAGALLILLQPPLPIRGGAFCPKGLPLHLCPRLWDERHIPMHASDDIAIWGEGLGAREHWARWLLLAAVVVAVAGASSTPAMPAAGGSKGIRVLTAGGIGLLLGWFLGLEVMPSQLLLQLMVGGGAVMSAIFISFLQLPKGMPSWTPLLIGFWGGGFATTMLLQAVVPLPPLPAKLRRLHPDHMMQVEAERHQLIYVTLLAIFAVEAMLMAFALKLKVDASLKKAEKRPDSSSEPGSSYEAGLDPSLPYTMDYFCSIVPSHLYKRFGRMLHLDGGAGSTVWMRRLHREGLSWAPSIGNVLVILTFFLGLVLLNSWEGESQGAIYMLASILLLLNQDPVLLPGLTHQQRYLPPVAVATAYLTYLTVGSIWEVVSEGEHPEEDVSVLWWTAKHLLLLLCVLPSHALFLAFLWGQRQSSKGAPWLLAPLSCLPLVFSNLPSLQFLAGGGLLMAVAQTMYVRQIRQASMKAI